MLTATGLPTTVVSRVVPKDTQHTPSLIGKFRTSTAKNLYSNHATLRRNEETPTESMALELASALCLNCGTGNREHSGGVTPFPPTRCGSARVGVAEYVVKLSKKADRSTAAFSEPSSRPSETRFANTDTVSLRSDFFNCAKNYSVHHDCSANFVGVSEEVRSRAVVFLDRECAAQKIAIHNSKLSTWLDQIS